MNKILVVDDDRGIRLLLSEELMDDGYDVVASDRAAGILSLVEEKPDLVVVEMWPATSGSLSLVQEIRKRFAGLPVILWTAHPFSRTEILFIRPDFCIAKSSDLGELKSRIRTALDGCPGPKAVSPTEAAPLVQNMLSTEAARETRSPHG